MIPSYFKREFSPSIGHSGKGKTVETIKISMVARGERDE